MKKSNFLSARKVHSNGITITGHFNSQKLKGIQFESLREESFLKLAEMDVSVTNVLDQPKKIDLDGFSYTPDFYLELKDRRPAYVEIKTTEFIKKLFKQEHWKVKMIENWCNLRNTDFLIIPVDKISDEIISNTFFLSGYRNVPVDNLMRQLIIKKLAEKKRFTQKELIEQLSIENSLDKRILLVQLWSLAASDKVLVEMNSNVNAFSKVQIKVSNKTNFLKFPYYI